MVRKGHPGIRVDVAQSYNDVMLRHRLRRWLLRPLVSECIHSHQRKLSCQRFRHLIDGAEERPRGTAFLLYDLELGWVMAITSVIVLAYGHNTRVRLRRKESLGLDHNEVNERLVVPTELPVQAAVVLRPEPRRMRFEYVSRRALAMARAIVTAIRGAVKDRVAGMNKPWRRCIGRTSGLSLEIVPGRTASSAGRHRRQERGGACLSSTVHVKVRRLLWVSQGSPAIDVTVLKSADSNGLRC